MTDTISKDDERMAREWAQKVIATCREDIPAAAAARTILALLDRPVMPLPDEVPDEALQEMVDACRYTPPENSVGNGMRAAYRALYDHYNPPPAPTYTVTARTGVGDGFISEVGCNLESAGEVAKGWAEKGYNVTIEREGHR